VKISIEIKGAEAIQKRIEYLKRFYLEALAAALYQEGFEIWRESVQRCPVETGLLRSSAYVAPPVGQGNPRVEVGFGTDYAIFVHERMDVVHPRGGEPKFLERTVDEHMMGYLERIAERTMANVKSGTGVKSLPAPEEPGA